jgi:hypothetical protein
VSDVVGKRIPRDWFTPRETEWFIRTEREWQKVAAAGKG